MGTSRSRRAPTTKLWQRAKRAMTRFATALQGDPALAADVFATYSLARQDSPAPFPPTPNGPTVTLETATQRVTDFYTLWSRYGLNLALKTLGWEEPGPQGFPVPFLSHLVDTLAGPGSDLEAAVARASLIAFLGKDFSGFTGEKFSDTSPKPSSAEVSRKVQEFVSLALYHQVMSDLGESLEAQAADVNIGWARASMLKRVIEQKVAAVMAEVPLDISWPQSRRHDWVSRSCAALGNEGMG